MDTDMDMKMDMDKDLDMDTDGKCYCPLSPDMQNTPRSTEQKLTLRPERTFKFLLAQRPKRNFVSNRLLCLWYTRHGT